MDGTRETETEIQKCTARTGDAWHPTTCSRNAGSTRLDHPVCTQHAKTYDKWASSRDYEGMKSMTGFWWHWRVL